MQTLLQDLRYGARMLLKKPGFTVIATLTLALGIGANTAIFSLVNAVLLKSLPIERPEELWLFGAARTYGVVNGQSGSYSVFSYPLYNYLRERSPFFQDLCAFQSQDTLIGVRRVGAPADATPPTMGKLVSGNYFSVLGVRAALGRTLLPEDDRAGAPPVAMMSYRYWSRNLGSSPEALGASVAINGVPVTITGIAPPEFFGETLKSDPPDFWLPLAAERVLNPTRPILDSRDSHWLFVMGRFQPTAATADGRTQARTRLTHDLKQWLETEGGSNPDAETRRRIEKSYIEFTPGGSGIQHMLRRYSDSLQILIAITGLVLAIACANLANLLLARGTARTREISVRLALGAARGRLMRQSLTESLVLSVAGGLAGLALAAFAQRALLAMVFRGSDYVPIAAEPDRTLLAFSFAVSILTGLVFGIAPAWSMARQDVAGSLRGVGAAGKGGVPQRGLLGFDFKKLLVAGQIAMSLVLLFGAGLLGRSLMNLEQQKLGFQRDRVMLFKIDPQFSGYRANQLDQLYSQIGGRLRGIPGVTDASYSLYSPFGSRWSSQIAVAGYTPPPGKPANSMWDRVGPRYFSTLGTRTVMGRVIDDRDQRNSKKVAVVNETFARMFLTGGNPLSGHLGFGDAHSGDIEVVGVVEDAKYTNPREPAEPMFFMPFGQMTQFADEGANSAQVRSNFAREIQIRTAADPATVAGAVRQALAEIAPNLAVLKTVTLEAQVGGTFNQERVVAQLTAGFSALALIVACVGLYGLMSYTVERRTAEIGVRMALGASGGRVARSFLWESLVQAAVGIAIGVPAALAAARLIAGTLYGLSAWDPITLAVVTVVLIAFAMLAAYLPARRASRVEPLIALRHE